MRILLIGGTRFVGRHIAAAALAAGHEVTLLHRGRTGNDVFGDKARHLLADRDDPEALATALAGGEWDATVDVCAYFPRQVRGLADALGGRGGRHVLISSSSVYDPEGPGFTEDGRVHRLEGPEPAEVTEANYGGLKVLCERDAADRHGESTLILRPTYIVGPWDPYGRLDHWAHRIARGGEVLAPGAPGAPIQVVDPRDIAAFTLDCLDTGHAGTFHLVGGSAEYTFADLLEDVRRGVGEPEVEFTWVADEFLIDAGVTAESLPMWSRGDRAEDLCSTADPGASLRAGLNVRPVASIARDVLTVGTAPATALTAEREAELLARWHSR
ncbi:NAD-dependent epimerase/dehydratase family protein [Phytomonospora sp. NPDC050363]|uniref:NAD-dependent epimerase/dehydratase family protein n=1 Tax=Phytomonospora sp. NPDC050363 TaxID=3155642 RepID=UPI003409BAF4